MKAIYRYSCLSLLMAGMVANATVTLPILLAYPKPSFIEGSKNQLFMDNMTPDGQPCSSGWEAIWGINNVREKTTFTSGVLSNPFSSKSLTWTLYVPQGLEVCLAASKSQLTDAKPQAVAQSTSTISIKYKANSTVHYTVEAKSLSNQLLDSLSGRYFVGCADDRDNSKVVICCYSADKSTSSCNWNS